MTKDDSAERIAKRLARAGVASRREAERMIEAGRVTVNGEKILSPALNVTLKDKITVDGAPLAAAEPPRLWRYHKPVGLVTTARDEKGRDTVFDQLPADLPRVMSIGRLDLNSEGLLLLTNDGELKRKLELPSTGWVRKYRVRARGEPSEDTLAPVRKGLTVDGERFQPMAVSLDRQQGRNVWLTISLREGKNREIRRALAEIGLEVNRLIRVAYGPFQLGELSEGEVDELRPRVLRDQLGIDVPRDVAKGAGRGPGAGSGARPSGGKPSASARGGTKANAAPRGGKPAGGKGYGARSEDTAHGSKPGGRGRKPSGGSAARFADPSSSLRRKPGGRRK